MFTITSRRTVAAALAIASIGACVPGVASAAKHNGARAGSHTATKTMTAARHVVTSPLGGVHGSIGGVTAVAQIQGGSTGDGPLGEEACERLGELAQEASDRGSQALADGNAPQANNSFDYAEAIIDIGMDKGCFFVW